MPKAGAYQSPTIGAMDDPYAAADRERDLDQTTPPSSAAKVSEDAKLAKGSGPIRPVSRIDKQLQGEQQIAATRRRMARSRSMGGKR